MGHGPQASKNHGRDVTAWGGTAWTRNRRPRHAAGGLHVDDWRRASYEWAASRLVCCIIGIVRPSPIIIISSPRYLSDLYPAQGATDEIPAALSMKGFHLVVDVSVQEDLGKPACKTSVGKQQSSTSAVWDTGFELINRRALRSSSIMVR